MVGRGVVDLGEMGEEVWERGGEEGEAVKLGVFRVAIFVFLLSSSRDEVG